MSHPRWIGILFACVTFAPLAAADPAASPPVKEVRNARISDGTPIWLEVTATDAYVVLDSVRDHRHERTYLSLPLANDSGAKLLYAAVEHAFATRTALGVVWIEAPNLGSPGPEWRKPEGHSYWQLQSVFNLTPDSTESYAAPPRVVTAHGEIKK